MATQSVELTARREDTAPPSPILSIHHPAMRCFDGEETRKFYEDIFGMKLAAAYVFNEDGMGNTYDFMHTFHRMKDGDFLGFFDMTDDIKPDTFTPFGFMDLRIGLKVSSDEELNALAGRLSAAGVKFVGPVDQGFMKSIYFKDPNGLNLEIAAVAPDHDSLLAEEKARARDQLNAWMARKGRSN